MRTVLRNNGLSLVLLFLFLLFWVGQALAGWHVFNDEQVEHAKQAISFTTYLTTSHFLEATAENWESEFLQMGVYVAFTAFLFQKGSAESKDPEKTSSTDGEGQHMLQRRSLLLWLYSYSLSLTFAALFVISFAVHAVSGHLLHNQDEVAHGRPAGSLFDFITGSQFWFEAMQNWQSEFLAVLAIAVLSIFLRHRGSPESKPVDMPNHENPE